MFGSLSRTLDTLLAMQEAVDSAQDTDYFGTSTTSKGVYPPINIFKKNDDFVLVAELPGIKKDDLVMEIKDNLLRIAGERKVENGKGISFHRKERKAYRFDRSIKLSFRVDESNLKAELNNGLLVVALPQSENDKPRQISIN